MKSLLIILTLVLATSCMERKQNACDLTASPVKTIGGCDKDGDCGVMLEDGTILQYVRQPVIGAKPFGLYCRKN